MTNKYFRLISDTAVFMIGNLLVKLIQFLLLPLYTSVMTTDDYGSAELLNNFTEMLFPIVTFTIYEAVFRYAIDKDVDKDALLYEGSRFLLKNVCILSLIAGLIWLFLRYPFTFYVLFVLVAYSFRMLFAYYVRGMGFSTCFSFSGVVNALVLSVCSWIFLIQVPMGVKGYLLALGFGHIASAITLSIGGHIPQRLLTQKRDSQLLQTLLLFSFPLIFNSIAWWVTNLSNRYVVLFAFGTGMAGLYTAANKLPAVITLITQVFRQAWQLNASREVGEQGVEQFYEKVFRIYTCLIFVFGSCVIGLTPLLARLTLKNEFFSARQYVPLMMLSVITHCISVYFESIMIAFKKTKRTMQGMVIGAVVNLILSVILVNLFGIWGVLCANLICYLCILAQRVITVHSLISIRLFPHIHIPLYLLLGIQAVLMSSFNIILNYTSYGFEFMVILGCLIANYKIGQEIWIFLKNG